ncbi:M28 family peptidase [Candidatus Zixiibacteriota bacterium]
MMKRGATRTITPFTAMILFAFGTIISVQAQQPLTRSGERGEARQQRQVPAERLAGMFDLAALDADIRFLSHDLLEGRAPSGRGEAITVEYIEARLRMIGAEGPFAGDSYRQPVPLVKQKASSDMALDITSRAGERTYAFGSQFVVDSGVYSPVVEVDGEIIFVGYGSIAPEFEWDDYKGMDLDGKILMMLVNDPPATAAEPDLFAGRAMTYYGRWTYKYEIAEEMGAQGVLLVHVTDMAGYGWNVVQTSWSGDQFSLASEQKENPLKMRGWVTRDVASEILGMAGHDLDELIAAAGNRDFRPVALGVQASTTIRNTTDHMTGYNVVGVLKGSDPQRMDEYVCYSAHLDHLGMGEGEGDVIYNGAVDNASGVAAVLNLADVLARLPEQMRARSFMFALVTAEESGLLGSGMLALDPPVPDTQIVSVLNLDSMNMWGETDDIVLVGGERSDLWDVVSEAAATLDMEVKPDPRPEVGGFFRSDHFSFAKVGVPATSLGAGDTYRGRPAGWGAEHSREWTSATYHQPTDEYDGSWVYTGVLQEMMVALMSGLQIAGSEKWIEWKPGDPFGRIRDERRGGR